MRLHSECVFCIFEHHWAIARRCPDEERQMAFLREVCQTLAQADPRFSAPVVTAHLQECSARHFPELDNYAALKDAYNDLLLERLPQLRERVRAQEDPLRLAVWMAMAGNYIDFGVLKDVDQGRLLAMLATPEEKALSGGELDRLREDLRRARRLTYITDNCGEIVLDRLLMEQIAAQYPQVEITALVRSGEVLNDATEADARRVGVDKVACVVGNGSNIGGTQREFLSAAAREAVEGADVLIAKGQGNFETLSGTGLNVYYLLLAKCPHYTAWFDMEHMAGQLINERRFFAR